MGPELQFELEVLFLKLVMTNEFPKSVHVEFPQKARNYKIHMNTSCKVANLLTNVLYSSLF